MTTKPYEPAALYRCYDKKSGACFGYLAPSRDGRDFYQVTCDEYGEWHCTCRATVKCCHIQAVNEVCAIRIAEGRPGCYQKKQQAALSDQEIIDLIDPDTVDRYFPEVKARVASALKPAQPATRIIAAPRGVAAIMHSDPRRSNRRNDTSTLNGNKGFSLMR